MAMDQHIEAVKARHAANPSEGRAYHAYVLDSLGLKGGAKEHILQERAASSRTLSKTKTCGTASAS